jgi:hypothetical protein
VLSTQKIHKMKINLQDINLEQFMVHQHFIGDVPVMLVQPCHIGASWDKDTLIFRSSVWDMDGNLVSAGWKKFFNDSEKPAIDPIPDDIKNGSILQKIDGSLLIFSKLPNGTVIIRTRGTVDAENQMDNGYEIPFLKEKYPGILRLLDAYPNCSILGEWTTPTNVIVLADKDEPDFYLLGLINHEDYSYTTQEEMDDLAEEYGLQRPKRYTFKTIDEMRAVVSEFRGVEGVCFYYKNDQCIRKFKGINYLYLHRAKSEISSIEKVIDLYINEFMQLERYIPYSEFMEYLERTFDFEIAMMARGHVSKICDAMREVHKIMGALTKYAEECKPMPRKDAALKILQAYGSTGRSAIIFKMLDAKPIGADEWKKLLFQVLK